MRPGLFPAAAVVGSGRFANGVTVTVQHVRLCMIGNSHVAALRQGWDLAAPEFPGIDATIFGQHARGLITAAVSEQGGLSTRTGPFLSFRAGDPPARAPVIALPDYDAFVLVGCDFGSQAVFHTYMAYHFSGLKSRQGRALSREVFKRVALKRLLDSAAFLLTGLIENTVQKPILVMPMPLPAESGYDDPDMPHMAPYRDARQLGDFTKLLAIYHDICAELSGQGLAQVHQPPDTLVDGLATRDELCRGSVRLRPDTGSPHPANDYFHMNAQYGAIMWREAVKALGEPADGSLLRGGLPAP